LLVVSGKLNAGVALAGPITAVRADASAGFHAPLTWTRTSLEKVKTKAESSLVWRN
jgi:hypothetical protein